MRLCVIRREDTFHGHLLWFIFIHSSQDIHINRKTKHISIPCYIYIFLKMFNRILNHQPIKIEMVIWCLLWQMTLTISMDILLTKSYHYQYTYIYSQLMKTQHLYFQYLSNIYLSIKILFSSDNFTIHILSKDDSLYWLIVNMHCLKALVQK